jgi:hypothetical protein
MGDIWGKIGELITIAGIAIGIFFIICLLYGACFCVGRYFYKTWQHVNDPTILKQFVLPSTMSWSNECLTPDKVKAISAWYNGEQPRRVMVRADCRKEVAKGIQIIGVDVLAMDYSVEDLLKEEGWTVNFYKIDDVKKEETK